MTPHDHASDDEVIQLDLYLDRLMAGSHGPTTGDAPVTDDLRDAADALAAVLTRSHPSFRFEERLARRLRAAALGEDVPGRPMGVLVPIARGHAEGASMTHGPTRSRSRRVGGAIVGGAIASTLSIASLAGAAALVAWRRGRSETGWERLV